MTLLEYVEDYLKDNFNKEVEEKKDKIISYLSSSDKISIKLRRLENNITELLSKANKSNNFMEEEKLIEFKDDSINIRSINSNLTKIILENLPSTVKELEIPIEVFNKMKISQLKNVEKLTLQGILEVNKEFLDRIKGLTNIKEITCRFDFDESLLNDGAIIFDDACKELSYNGIIIKNEKLFDEMFLSIKCKDPYKSMGEIVSTKDLSKTTFNIANLEDNGPYNNIVIKYNSDGEIQFNSFNNISEIYNALKLLRDNNVEIKDVKIMLENRDYDDIYTVTKIRKEFNTTLCYDNSIKTVELQDFIAMRETLNYFKGLINEANLSPLEKVLYAYDLIKSLEYKEDDENRSNARHIDKIIKTGNIVCVGYSVFLKQLLTELGIECIAISASVPRNGKLLGHERNIIKIEDDKYNIRGSFALDATWDSAKNACKILKEDGTEGLCEGDRIPEGAQILKRYDNLCLYTYFMIPAAMYTTVFRGEKEPSFIDYSLRKREIDLNSNIKDDFVTVEGIDTETLLSLIANVRIKQGYSREETIKSIKDIVEIRDILKKKNEEGVITKK